jgi:hypothetical protein
MSTQTVQTPGTIQFITNSNTSGLLCADSWCYQEPGGGTTWNVQCEPSTIIATQGSLTSCTQFIAKSKDNGQCLTNYGDGQLRILACPEGYPPDVVWQLQPDGPSYRVLSSKMGTANGYCMLSSGFVGDCSSGPSYTNLWNPKGSAMTPLPPVAPPLSSQTIGIIVGCVLGVLALLAIGCGILWWKRKKARGDFNPKDQELPTIEGLETKAVSGSKTAKPPAPIVPKPTTLQGADYNSIPQTPANVSAPNPMYDSFVAPPRNAGPGGSALPANQPSQIYESPYTPVMNVNKDPGIVIPKRQASTRSPANYSAEADVSSGPETVIGNTVVALQPTYLSSPANSAQPMTIQLGQSYTAVLTYYQTLDDEITVLSGERIKILEVWDDGWCRCQSSAGLIGMVPCSVITGEEAK